ncbi:MAG: response regulator [Lachnospiraceae bacterium]|nr:response regulator [Lachnospiraceae bacterium]
MILTYYYVLFALSIITLFTLFVRWQKKMDIYFAIFFIFVPIDLLGYIKLASATNLETAILGNQLIYLGGCFLQLIVLLVVCNLCNINLKPGLVTAAFAISLAIYLSTLTMGHNGLFYKDVKLIHENGVSVLVKEYGPAHTIFYIMIVGYMVATIIALIYGYRKKRDASLKNMNLLAILMAFAVIAFFGGRAITKSIELTPATYIINEVAFLFIAHRIRLYSISGDIAVSVLEEGADGLICFDLKRRLLVANKTAQEMIPELVDAQTDHLLNETINEFREIGGYLSRFIDDEQYDEELMQIGGKAYQINIKYINDGKKNVGYYLVLRDVTTERKYIESINNYNEQMRNAADAAIAADNAKTRFLAQMSHEIRTPINAVLGMNTMIMQETDDDNIYDYASAIQTSGRTLLFLINSILDFSKIEDGKMEIYEVEYDLVGLINNLVNSAASSAEAKNLKFDVEVDERLPIRLIGDDMRITQVVINLLSNAVKYTDEGKVTLKISQNDSFNPKNEDSIWIHVEVCDTGIGIRKEDQFRLFESFERLDVTRNRNVEGTGLGMSIVYKLLELMGSHIYVKSEYGSGSVFWFDISQKIADRTPMGSYKERRSLGDIRSKKHIKLYAPEAKILVVDDNPLNQKVTRAYLKLCGIVPDEAMSGAEALEYMRNKQYDVVFLDHMMPEMDGIETLDNIRREKLASEDTIIVALTANAIEGSRDKYLRAGFNDYISKPVELTDMVAKLEDYLDKRGYSEDQ